MKRTWLTTAVVLVSIVPALAGTEASASCAVVPGQTPGSIATASVVFVGNVVSTTNGGREATVKVDSIWRGPSLLTYVRVIGTPDPAAQATSVDRTYEVGRRYLFVPQNSSSPFQDNNCSATQPYTSALALQAPAYALAPQPGGDPGPPPGLSFIRWLGAGLILLLLGAGGMGWFWRVRSKAEIRDR